MKSVAMAFYNGAKYIDEQIRSILDNMEETDELIISVDDASDGSEAILEDWVQNDQRIRIIKGPGKGVVKNFENAFKHCRGEIIFLSDQDDVLGVIVSAILILIGTVFINPILGFLNVPGKLFIEAKQYILIIIIGLWVTMFYDILMAVMRAIGDTLTPLLILAISVGLNIVLDLLFVAVWKTGTWGAAAATVLAQFIALVICCFYMIHKYELLRLNKNDFKDLESKMIKEMLATGMSMGFMSSLVNIGSLTLQTAINKLGQEIIVAHTAARKITEIYMIMFSVFGQTMATFCGQNMGAGKVDRIKEGMKLAIIYTCVWSTFAMIASYTIGPQLVHMVTGSHKDVVIVNATNYLKFNTIFYYVPAVISIVRNVMQGIGDQITPLVSSGLEMVGKVVIAFTLVPLMGYAGVIVAEPIVWFIMVIPLIVQIIRTPKLKANK